MQPTPTLTSSLALPKCWGCRHVHYAVCLHRVSLSEIHCVYHKIGVQSPVWGGSNLLIGETQEEPRGVPKQNWLVLQEKRALFTLRSKQ